MFRRSRRSRSDATSASKTPNEEVSNLGRRSSYGIIRSCPGYLDFQFTNRFVNGVRTTGDVRVLRESNVPREKHLVVSGFARGTKIGKREAAVIEERGGSIVPSLPFDDSSGA